MIRRVVLAGGLFAAAFAAILLTGGNAQINTNETPDFQGEVERGRYLVHQVCLCVICHSPRDATGELIDARLLTGGTIPLESPYPGQDWAFRAPKIAGLPAGWSEEELVRFLQTREAPRGLTVRLPMPPFHLDERDARAVAAYLRSLR